jgi:hypothetical protein
MNASNSDHPKLTATEQSGTVTISQEDALAALE